MDKTTFKVQFSQKEAQDSALIDGIPAKFEVTAWILWNFTFPPIQANLLSLLRKLLPAGNYQESCLP